ncbi:hypothetical protein [Methylorubrum sp. Q1]|uniref:hypothetical protein n=1 Tax=Methylorubrum sp. Q1 TaxID=2562453 RepID=UPI00187D258B|nr:hypothetical protein [Methylorubrum sp. Q1]
MRTGSEAPDTPNAAGAAATSGAVPITPPANSPPVLDQGFSFAVASPNASTFLSS